MIAPGTHGALGDWTGHGGGLGRSILLDHKKPSSMRSLGLDSCVGFWRLAVLFRRPVDVEWGRRAPQPPRGRSGNQSVFREALLDAGRWFKRLHVAVELGCSLRARVPKQPGSIVEDHPDLLELHREARPQDAEVALDPDLPEHLVADAVPSIAAVKAPRNPGLKFLSVLTSLGASHRRGAWRGSFPRRAAPWSRSCHPHPTAGSSSTRTSATWCDIRPGRRRAHGEPRPGLDLRQGPVPDGARGQYSLSKAWRRSRTRASRTISP